MGRMIVLLMLISVIMPVKAHANVVLTERTVVTQGSKAITIATERNLTAAAGRSLVRTCAARMAAGGAGVMVHPLVGVIITAVGAYSLYEDCEGMLDEMGWPESYVDAGSRIETNIAGGKTYQLVLSTKYSGYYNAVQSFTAGMYPNGISFANCVSHYGPDDAYLLCGCINGNCNDLGYVRAGYSVTWSNQTGVSDPAPVPSTSYDTDEEALQEDLDAKTDQEIQDGIETGIIESSSAPTGGVEGEEVTPKLYYLEGPQSDGQGGEIDPVTGQEYNENVDPGEETDTMSVPGQPGVPDLDTAIDQPEENDIGELISGWLDNAPFMAIITAFEVNATSGQSVFTIPLPEVLGGTGTIDFGQFSGLWAAMGAIIIGISYIYGAMIIFGGKS